MFKMQRIAGLEHIPHTNTHTLARALLFFSCNLSPDEEKLNIIRKGQDNPGPVHLVLYSPPDFIWQGECLNGSSSTGRQDVPSKGLGSLF